MTKTIQAFTVFIAVFAFAVACGFIWVGQQADSCEARGGFSTVERNGTVWCRFGTEPLAPAEVAGYGAAEAGR